MESFIVEGGRCLEGEIHISGAKNAALLLMAATLLTKGCSVLENVPMLRDTCTMGRLLQDLGSRVEYVGSTVSITSPAKISPLPPTAQNLAKAIRASVVLLGPSVARNNDIVLSLPGGCDIGPRPINEHVSALSKLGAEVDLNNTHVWAKAKRLKGTKIIFGVPTVTGTANTIMAAVLAEGETVLENAARDPEVVELAKFLNAMGAEVYGAGTAKISIRGVETLRPVKYRVIPDRIEAGTFMIAAAITGGNILLRNVQSDHLDAVIAKLRAANVEIKQEENGIRVRANGTIHPINVTTGPYPGFPTDLQPQMMALATVAEGEGAIRELVFENRFRQVPELERMGAKIETKNQTATIRGNSTGLHGAHVKATDLRAGAALVLVALAASGNTVITRAHYIDRGYEQLEHKLAQVGANIRRLGPRNHLRK